MIRFSSYFTCLFINMYKFSVEIYWICESPNKKKSLINKFLGFLTTTSFLKTFSFETFGLLNCMQSKFFFTYIFVNFTSLSHTPQLSQIYLIFCFFNFSLSETPFLECGYSFGWMNPWIVWFIWFSHTLEVPKNKVIGLRIKTPRDNSSCVIWCI